jgi:glutamine amidotransferase|tara:strand:- start:4231 stop:4842 length:612 start_codon:yes stop_codon:yes gene_type:complete
VKKVCIINTESGNQRSVYNAIKDLNYSIKISNDKKDLEESTHLILPGVGAYKNLMSKINKQKLIEVLFDQIMIKKKPFLGICVGMQILSSFGYEFEESSGLNYIKGKVIKLDAKLLRLPHVGWNNLKIKKNSDLFNGLEDETYFYFVHSYVFEVENDKDILSVTNYDQDFVSSVQKENIFGVQFHPEKSQKTGLLILKNFINL